MFSPFTVSTCTGQDMLCELVPRPNRRPPSRNVPHTPGRFFPRAASRVRGDSQVFCPTSRKTSC